MKRQDVKSRCPINFTLETFGDPWSLLIVRDMISEGKKTYGEFLDSEERIGPRVLADRRSYLKKKGIITKHPDQHDKRKKIYTMTETGLNIIPIIYQIPAWGSYTIPNPKGSKP